MAGDRWREGAGEDAHWEVGVKPRCRREMVWEDWEGKTIVGLGDWEGDTGTNQTGEGKTKNG